MNTHLRRSVPDLDLLRQSMDRLFTDTVATTDSNTAPSWAPRADVVESDDTYHIVLDLPGITQENLDVSFEDGTLSVSGERAVNDEYTKGRFHRVERSYGRFFRSFTLGSDVDAEKIDASFTDGVLTIDVPKAEASKPRQISVRLNGGSGVAATSKEAELVEA